MAGELLYISINQYSFADCFENVMMNEFDTRYCY